MLLGSWLYKRISKGIFSEQELFSKNVKNAKTFENIRKYNVQPFHSLEDDHFSHLFIKNTIILINTKGNGGCTPDKEFVTVSHIFCQAPPCTWNALKLEVGYFNLEISQFQAEWNAALE